MTKIRIVKMIDIIWIFVLLILFCFKQNKVLLTCWLMYLPYMLVTFSRCQQEDTVYFAFRNLVCFVAGIHYLSTVNFLKTGTIFVWSGIVPVLVFVGFCIAGRKRLKTKNVLSALLFSVMLMFYLGDAMIMSSQCFAFQPVTSGTAEVTNQNIPSRSFLEKWGDFTVDIRTTETDKFATVKVNRDFYYQCQVGDQTTYTVYSGLWNERYIRIDQ